MKNIFLKKSYTKCGGEASLRPFNKKNEIQHISGSTAWNVTKFVFIVSLSQGLSKSIKKFIYLLLLLPYTKLFKKTERLLELVSLPHFLHGF